MLKPKTPTPEYVLIGYYFQIHQIYGKKETDGNSLAVFFPPVFNPFMAQNMACSYYSPTVYLMTRQGETKNTEPEGVCIDSPLQES